MVIFGPMFQVGWARASLTDALVSSSRVHPRNGPPDAVMITRFRSSRRSPRRHWARAECSESTGISRSGSPLTRSMISSPPTTSDSLLARASIFPDCKVARDGPSPMPPTMAFSTMSASDSRASVSMAWGPDSSSTSRTAPIFAFSWAAACSSAIATRGGRNSRTCPTSSSWLVPAPRPTTRNRSGLRRTTSSAWVPIEPVEPRIASDLIVNRGYPGGTGLVRPPPEVGSFDGRTWLEDEADVVEGGGGDQQGGVDPIQDPTVSRQQRSHVLHSPIAFDQRLDQSAEGGEHDDHQGKPEGLGQGQIADGRRHQDDGQGEGHHGGTEQTLP